MSTKTNFKRVALVAVAALGLGVLTSVAPASATVTTTAGILRTAGFSYSAVNSMGICTMATDTTTDAAQVGEVLSSGVIGLVQTEDISMDVLQDSVTLSISGPATWDTVAYDADAPATVSYAGTLKSVTFTATNLTSADSLPTLLKARVNGTGSVQITLSVNDGGVGTVIERWTLTASATCATGTAAAVKSVVKVIAYGTDQTAITTNATETEDKSVSGAYTTNYASSADRISNGGEAWVGVRIKDATTAANDVTTQGVFSATATNGAIIGWTDAQLLLDVSTATASGAATGTAQTALLQVAQGTANEDKPVVTTVSIFWNGVLYGTRSITFTGKATAVTIVPAYSSIAKSGTTAKYAMVYEITDAAGNKLTSEGPGVNGAYAFSNSTGENNPVLATSGVVVDATQTVVSSISTINVESSGFAGTVDIGCGTSSGTAKVYLKHTFSNLTSLASAQYDMACSYGTVNYKASLDKASYSPGEIATLTITATDKYGKSVYDVDATPDNEDLGSSTYPVSISMPLLTAVVAATNTDEWSGGKKTYKFTVGSTEGSYSGVVDLPLFDSTTYAQTALTISYKVASGSTAISLADVLKAIVSLIASINKQIAALQKALLKK
jgi:hypothetical protein